MTPNPTGFVIGDTTLTPGSPAVTVSGTPVSLAASGTLVIGGSIVVLPTAPVVPPMNVPGMGSLINRIWGGVPAGGSGSGGGGGGGATSSSPVGSGGVVGNATAAPTPSATGGAIGDRTETWRWWGVAVMAVAMSVAVGGQ